MNGKKFEVGKKYTNGFSVSEYGHDLDYSFKYLVVSRTAKFVVLYDESRNKNVKCMVHESTKDGHEWIHTNQIYPYHLSANQEVA